MSGSRISELEMMIYKMKERQFEFLSIGYGDDLRISMNHGWDEINGFKSNYETGFREFAKEMNEATKPVREKFLESLKQRLANECLKTGGNALQDKERLK